jgi:hypothetical protein
MLRGGIRGINKVLTTGRVLLNGIPIGATTNIPGITTRIFMNSTIVARVAVGIKASMGSVLPEPQVLPFAPLVQRSTPLGPLVRRLVPPGPLNL